MKEKKLMIPIILGVILLCGIVFTVVYKKTNGTNPNNIQEEQTLAPKETQTIETRISIDEIDKDLDNFSVNETKGREAGDGVDIEYLDSTLFEDVESSIKKDSIEESMIESEVESIQSNIENSQDSIRVDALVSEENIKSVQDSINNMEEEQRAKVEITPEKMQELYELSGY